jgi:hypothetical protein
VRRREALLQHPPVQPQRVSGALRPRDGANDGVPGDGIPFRHSAEQVPGGGEVPRAARRGDGGVVGVGVGVGKRAEGAERVAWEAGEGVELDEAVEEEGVGGESAGDYARVRGLGVGAAGPGTGAPLDAGLEHGRQVRHLSRNPQCRAAPFIYYWAAKFDLGPEIYRFA